MKFDFEKYKGQKVAMHCKTEREAIDFCNYMHEYGKKWINGKTYKQTTNYSVYGSETCYCFNNGTYSKRKYLIKERSEILEWSDYMNKCFTKADLRNGDICVNRNGSALIAIADIRSFAGYPFAYSFDDFHDNLKHRKEEFDIMRVYRPKNPYDCCLDFVSYEGGELVFDRDTIEPVEVTLEEIAALKGASVDRIRIKD